MRLRWPDAFRCPRCGGRKTWPVREVPLQCARLRESGRGAISHGPVSPLREYLAAQQIQALATASTARIVVFPESVVPRWTVSTDLFWKPTIDTLRQNGKVVVIGALIPESPPLSNGDVHAAIDLLQTAHVAQPIPGHAEPYYYRNVAIIRGTQSGMFFQRMPVPVSVWKPFSRGGAPLHWAGRRS